MSHDPHFTLRKMESSQLFSKPTTSQFRELSIFDLKRLGLLKLGYRSNLIWSVSETKKELVVDEMFSFFKNGAKISTKCPQQINKKLTIQD